MRVVQSRLILTLIALTLLLIGTAAVLASDGRINQPPYHLGGDTLYCNSETGCTLVNKDGQDLWNWSQPSITAAFDELDETGVNTLVGTGAGTYGPASLWAAQTDETNDNKRLCLVGVDEWYKENSFCFSVTLDGNYEEAPLPIPQPSPSPTVIKYA